MSDRADVLMRFYTDNSDQSRQHERHRERFTNLFLGISGATIALIARDPEARAAAIAAVALLVFSVLSCLISFKHYERHRFHRKIMEIARRELDSEMHSESATQPSKPSLEQILQEAKREHSNRPNPILRRFTRVRLYWLWAGIPLLIFVVTVAIMVSLMERHLPAL